MDRGVVACAVLLVALLAGCSSDSADPSPTAGPVDIDLGSPTLSVADQARCDVLVAALPDTLAGQQRRTDVPAGPGAAYGDPAIVVRCGVSKPAGFDPTAVPGKDDPTPCIKVNRVGWFVPRDEVAGDRDATLTAVTYKPRISVTVPRTYLPEGSAAALAELSDVVKGSLRLALRCS